jgi:hypothetical protein
MEIRRCDKCDKALDPERIEHFGVNGFESEVSAVHIIVPVLKESMIVPLAETGLDDRDTFGSSFYGKRIDLCSDCYPLLARVMTDWLK